MNTDQTPTPSAATAGSDHKRFWNKVSKSDTGCWNWTGASSDGRYGVMHWNGRYQLAHRISWIIHFGSIPENKCVLHHCDDGRCVRPDHLFLGSSKENSQDMVNKRRWKNKALTETNVRTIRLSVGLSRRELADYFDVSPYTISQIQRRKTWKHIA